VLKRYVQAALILLSTVHDKKDTYIKLFPCISMRILDKLEPVRTILSNIPLAYYHFHSHAAISTHILPFHTQVLDPKVCVKMYSCVYGLPESYFDAKAIKLRQETINESSAKKSRIEETQKISPSTRPQQTDDQKSKGMANKAEKGNDT